VGALSRSASGHSYFALKDEDEDALVEAVLYRGASPRAERLLADGARVVCTGRITVYAPRGRMQFVVDAVAPVGRGALLEALEALKRKLAAEGLFAAERKRRMPREVRTVAVVTSRDGAAIHDVARVAFRRGRVRLVLVPTVVQGAAAPKRIAEAVARAGRLGGVDVVLVTRGGGSAEDLAAFNDERVVRAVAACPIPIVSAVGHEVDTTLTDLAADARAATPSQAAELLVAEEAEQRARLEQLRLRLGRAMSHALVDRRGELARLRRRLGEPRRLVLERGQRFDELASRAERAMRRRLAEAHAVSDALRRRLEARHPRVLLAAVRARVTPLEARLRATLRQRLAVLGSRLEGERARLEALSPLAVLARGYAIATGEDGRILFDVADLQPGDGVWVRLARGRLHGRVDREPERGR
ncbi:MAG: exodeoxyribonuclease VII large subunit, partial [Myxococcales bacterium]|nr:exodeoxyribonuclease VII large subunit [Myxococcales bacterium]